MIWLNEMNAWLEGNDGMGGNGWRMIWLNEMNVWLEGNDGMGGNGWRMMGRGGGAMVTIIGPYFVVYSYGVTLGSDSNQNSKRLLI